MLFREPIRVFRLLGNLIRIAEVPRGDTTVAEFQLFSYLACLLSLYRREPASEWGYTFAGTKQGAPFSVEIATAIEEHQIAGTLALQEDRFTILPKGREWHTLLLDLQQNKSRQRFIEGACASSLAIPIGLVRSAIAQDSAIQTAIKLKAARPLFDKRGVDMLYEQFVALSEAIGVQGDDLMLPAVVWVMYFARLAEATDHTEGPA